MFRTRQAENSRKSWIHALHCVQWLLLSVALVIAVPGEGSAQATPESLLEEARSLYKGDATPRADLERVRALLDQIVSEFPSSNIAVDVILGDVAGVDVPAIDQALAAPATGANENGNAGAANPPDSNPITEAKDTASAGDDATVTGQAADQAAGGQAIANAARCIDTAFSGDAGNKVVVSFSVADGGTLSGIPSLIEPTSPDAEDRSLFFGLAQAIDGCAPFDGLSGVDIIVTIAPGAPLVIDELEPAAETSADVAVLPRPVSQGPADNGVAEDGTTATASAQQFANPVEPPEPGSEATEAELDLDKGKIRDLQARLLVLGYDPNGIDGLAGRGTRAALRDWQAANQVEGNGFLGRGQLDLLRGQSQQALEQWLENPENARVYDPPMIELGPRNVSGTWRFTSNCGANSRLGRIRIRGTLVISHAGGGRYTGRARQSQGFNGRFDGRLSGRKMSGEINWGLLVGRTRFTGTVDDTELVIRGSDSNRCGFYARKG